MNHDISEPIQCAFYEYLVTICYILFAKQYSMPHVGCLVFILEINPMPSTCQFLSPQLLTGFCTILLLSYTWKTSSTRVKLGHMFLWFSHLDQNQCGSQADHLVSVVDASQIVMIWRRLELEMMTQAPSAILHDWTCYPNSCSLEVLRVR